MRDMRLKPQNGVGTALGDRTLSFTFDGKSYRGRLGDTLASALLANGVKVVGRSFKYHRPRGIFTAGSEEPTGLVTLRKGSRREPNIRATEVELYDGLVAQSQNNWPSPKFDLMSVNQLGGKALAAGFYYKTFMGPQVPGNRGTQFWRFCEHAIRRAAGLGRGASHPDPDRYARMNAWCDLLVVGSGAAGIAAVRQAAGTGCKIIWCEQAARAGGALNASPDRVDSEAAASWAKAEIERLAALPNVTLLTRTTVQGYFDGNTFLAVERVADHKAVPRKGEPRQRAWTIRAGEAVIATGALERSMVFPGNDRPGVMLADAARLYAVAYGVEPGRNVCVFTNNDSGWLAARDMAACGVIVSAIVDTRADISDVAREAGRSSRAELHLASAVVKTTGWQSLSSVKIAPFNEVTGKVGDTRKTITCDCLAVSGGWSPAFHLTSQQGTQPVWDAELQAFLPGEPTQNWHGAGAMMGRFGLAAALEDGHRAAMNALERLGQKSKEVALPDIEADAIDHAPAPVYEIPVEGKAFVDLQHDVTADDVRLAHREGYISVEHLKRYTTLGMATDQGKLSNILGLAIMAEARKLPIPDVGTTRFRPPYTPVTLGAMAGEQYGDLRPQRLTPMHDWHQANGAAMVPNGLWMRPESYNGPGESVEQAYIREAKTVRQGVGMVDVSTLGKIDVQGPDAAEFLNRVYTNAFAKLPVGKARYGLMVREDGFLFDDGTTWRLDEHRYLMTTTTAGAGKVMEHLEYHLNVAWPDLKVALTSVTDVWAGVAVAGPKSRAVLAACVEGCDVGNEGLPFMGVRQGNIDGIAVWIARLSFSGELAYEVYCGAHHGQSLWDALMRAGEPHGITPYGLEALTTLRIEKGHVAGQELNGRTTPHDLGLGGMVSTKKNFIGSTLLKREALHEADRLQLVAIRSIDGQRIPGGSHLVTGSRAEPGRSRGHVTVACFSPELNAYVALAMLEGGTARHGERMLAVNPVRNMAVTVDVISPHMVDPNGERMHA